MAVLRRDGEAAGMLRKLESEERVLSAAAMTVYDLMEGARLSARAEENTKVLTLSKRLRPLPIGLEEAELASYFYTKLTRSGRMTGEFDLLIAAAARADGETLPTRDDAFRGVEVLKTLRW